MIEFRSLAVFSPDWRNLLTIAIVIAGALVVGTAAHRLLFVLGLRAVRGRHGLFTSLIRFAEAPGRVIISLLALLVAVPWLHIAPSTQSMVLRALELSLIGALGWLAIAALNAFQDFVADKYTVDAVDNLAARRMRTQVQVLRHIAVAVVVIVTISVMLMTFPNVRHVGESLFASAGLSRGCGWTRRPHHIEQSASRRTDCPDPAHQPR